MLIRRVPFFRLGRIEGYRVTRRQRALCPLSAAISRPPILGTLVARDEAMACQLCGAGVTIMQARIGTMWGSSQVLLWRGLLGTVLALLGFNGACAGEVRSTFELGALQLVEIAPAMAGQRPHRALRIRFDGATKAVRSLGLDATDCGSVLRSNSGARRFTDVGIANGTSRPAPTMFVGLNCRF